MKALIGAQSANTSTSYSGVTTPLLTSAPTQIPSLTPTSPTPAPTSAPSRDDDAESVASNDDDIMPVIIAVSAVSGVFFIMIVVAILRKRRQQRVRRVSPTPVEHRRLSTSKNTAFIRPLRKSLVEAVPVERRQPSLTPATAVVIRDSLIDCDDEPIQIQDLPIAPFSRQPPNIQLYEHERENPSLVSLV